MRARMPLCIPSMQSTKHCQNRSMEDGNINFRTELLDGLGTSKCVSFFYAMKDRCVVFSKKNFLFFNKHTF